ncbi:thioesterase II family protein [Paractinoplanes brasiliensis]|uniref:Surfactin synthase thioesterase subunit n=1 Tax=Paractinoplanes brasiliensis TaxID=52695 RepID=A0A4R6JKJ3_9ACTN|nr:alpha/beta fold hydrolase [Actinoplanes brasiliensis]TDO36760.1 surfactin synthase thioesterase subunit [Actinoplanes brasiliensis]GID33463.1 thioesterase [Actinoplanes brasiliensis]
MDPIAPRPRAGRAGGWIAGPQPRRTPALRLFCLPYVGGGAQVYEPWRGAFGEDVEVCPVELPGRQTRMRDRPYTRLDALVGALAAAVVDELDVPYALFGHSMGSLVAFELAHELRRRGAGEPCVLFVSAGPAPRLPRLRPPLHAAPEERVVARLAELGGLPQEILDEPELLRYFLPAIRADFEVIETYEYPSRPPLVCPVVAFTGSEDEDLPPAGLTPWGEETTGRFDQFVLPGGHFFLRGSEGELLTLMRGALAPYTRSWRRFADA